MRIRFVKIIGIVSILSLTGCGQRNDSAKTLPIMGRPTITTTLVDGKEVNDTIDHKIKSFAFLNQDSILMTNDSLNGKIYVADFFFTSCPSICPIMKKQLLRVYDKFGDRKDFSILSYTIDPGHDDVPLLHDYAERLGVTAPGWHFLTGDLFAIYDLAETSYMVYAEEDAAAPGGFAHSGAIALVDKERRIRGVYDGTVEEQVDLLLKDIDRLFDSYEKN